MRSNNTLKIAVVANLVALSTLLYFFIKFPLPFIFPAFLDIQFSNLPAIIGGFMFGPYVGAIIVVARQIIKLPFTSTAGVGELADLIIGISTVVVSSVIYMKMRTKKGAIIASLFGMLTWVIVAIFANYFILIPFFISYFLNGNVEVMVGMLSVIPGVTVENYMVRYVFLAVIPFNVLLSGIVYGLTFLVYKRLVHLIEAINDKMKEGHVHEQDEEDV